MKDPYIKIDLGAVQTTLLLLLYARAKEAEMKEPTVCDTNVSNLVFIINYAFYKSE